MTRSPPLHPKRPVRRSTRRGFLHAAGAVALVALSDASAQSGAPRDAALIAAAECGDTITVRKLLAEGADVNRADRDGGVTPRSLAP
jgi:hypothetical protein